MSSIQTHTFAIPFNVHSTQATTPDEVSKLYRRLCEGDIVRVNDRKRPMKVERVADGIEVVSEDGHKNTLEEYNGREYTVRVVAEESYRPVKQLAVVSSSLIPTQGVTVNEIKQALCEGRMWIVEYTEYNSGTEEMNTVQTLTTQLKYTSDGVLALYNHISRDSEVVYTTFDTVQEITPIAELEYVPPQITTGDSVVIEATDHLQNEIEVFGDVVTIQEYENNVSYLINSEDGRYTASHGVYWSLLHESSFTNLEPNKRIQGVVTKFQHAERQ